MASFRGLAGKIVALTPGATAFARTFGLLVTGGGTANITDATGADIDNVPLQAGYNPLSVTKLRALGTATGVFALYENE